MTPAERIDFYRALAAAYERKARQASDPTLRQQYTEEALAWARLADSEAGASGYISRMALCFRRACGTLLFKQNRDRPRKKSKKRA